MVVKKKMTYKKQKGGLVLPKKIYDYFNSIKYLINLFYDEIDIKVLPNSFRRIDDLKNNIMDWSKSDNRYIVNLALKIYNILKEKNNITTVEKYKGLILEILKCALLEVFFSLPANKPKLVFPDILKKIFINILFIDYLKLDISAKNKLNKMFEEKIMNLLNILFHITSLDDKKYLIGLLRTLFLEEYQRIDGVPVFYGNTLDSYYNQIRGLGYNQFICEKVGVSSKDKRNYIINPVGALAWMYIDKLDYLGTPLYILLRKILRFDYVQGNKRQDLLFKQLPKLEYLRPTTTKFCIAIDKFNNEEIYQEPTNDVSMCSKLYGCSLKMTAEIRPENIASDEHILELLSILLAIELDNPIPTLNISDINNSLPRIIPQNQLNIRRNGSVLSPVQEFRTRIPEVQINLNTEITEYDRRYYDKYFEKLQEEAYKLINNTKNNKNDIQKIKKLLELFQEIIRIGNRPNPLNYYKLYIPPIIYEFYRKLESRLSYLEKIKINNFYNTPTENLLLNENYDITLDKLYKEARRLTIKEIEPRDIPKIKKLLEIIKLIQQTRHRITNIKSEIINNFSTKFSYLKSRPILQRNSRNITQILHDFSRFYPPIINPS